jgi:hypothetical protein
MQARFLKRGRGGLDMSGHLFENDAVGVLLDDGTTEVELDLGQLEWAPTEFRNR